MQKDGCRWSIIYTLNGITLLLLAVNGILQMMGAMMLVARILGGCCCCLLSCTNFAAIIVTGVFRFNWIGSVAALSNVGSEYSGGEWSIDNCTPPPNSDDNWTSGGKCPPLTGRTYAEEADWIIGLWVIQMVWCYCGGCIISSIQKPPAAPSM